MAKVRWHTMMSLDGFIAAPDDDMQWVFGVDGGGGKTADEVVRATGALLVGRRTEQTRRRPETRRPLRTSSARAWSLTALPLSVASVRSGSPRRSNGASS